MIVIPTVRKEKLPKGFSYPLGAEAISAALGGLRQLERAEITFQWRDEFWASRWRKRVQNRGVLTLLRVAFLDYFGSWRLDVYSVPSQYSVQAREHLQVELLRIHSELASVGGSSKSFKAAVTICRRLTPLPAFSGAELAASARSRRGR